MRSLHRPGGVGPPGTQKMTEQSFSVRSSQFWTHKKCFLASLNFDDLVCNILTPEPVFDCSNASEIHKFGNDMSLSLMKYRSRRESN